MYSQLKPPSISKIRAKFIIEKLGNYPRNIDNINLFFTGRTGAGKTTLSNRLLGSDYFLSTGHQDCTKEINLIEFPIGLKCFDTPGVCSDELLENYNRVALGINQIEDCPIVEDLTLARYRENCSAPQEENLSISEFVNLQFQPDLIYYLIAPEKLFTRGDRQYLRDLLKFHQNIIYVFNMFVNKQTGMNYFAKESNIKDTATQILKVHHKVLGKHSQPVIIGVNCFTGEGISDLLHESEIMLKGNKGQLFKELIQYQQQQTPDEYVNQVKQELIRLYAHGACQKATGSDTCDQPLHLLSYSLFDFIVSLPIQSDQDDNSIAEQVKNIVSDVCDNPIVEKKSESLEDKFEYLIRSKEYIFTERIEYFNQLIKTSIFDRQKQAYDLRNKEFEEWETEEESVKQKLDEDWDSILAIIQELDKLNTLLESLNQEIEELIDEYNPRIDANNSRYLDISSRRHNLNSRLDSWKDRLKKYNANIDRINRSSARLTYESKRSLDKESDYLEQERSSIKSEDSYLESLETEYKKNIENIEEEKAKIKTKIDQRDAKKEEYECKKQSLFNNLKEYNIFKKNAQDESKYCFELIKYFNDELSALDDKIEQRIQEINLHIKEIRNPLSKDYLEKFTTIEDAIDELQKLINRCLDEMAVFENQIFTFNQDLNYCIFQVNINKMVTQVLQKTTEHYFDETGQFEYRFSDYHYFGKHGITVLLALTIMIFFDIDKDYEVLYSDLLQKVEKLGSFPENPIEAQIYNLLSCNYSLLFEATFDNKIKQATMTN